MISDQKNAKGEWKDWEWAVISDQKNAKGEWKDYFLVSCAVNKGASVQAKIHGAWVYEPLCLYAQPQTVSF